MLALNIIISRLPSHFLVAGSKDAMPEVKGGKVYFGSQLVEVLVHSQLAPRQARVAEEKQPTAGHAEVAEIKQHQHLPCVSPFNSIQVTSLMAPAPGVAGLDQRVGASRLLTSNADHHWTNPTVTRVIHIRTLHAAVSEITGGFGGHM